MSVPTDTTRCSRCGAEKAAAAPCPHCLLQLGLAAGSAPQSAAPGARPAAPTPEELARHFPGLEIHEAIGHGGMGVVYRARHKKLDRLVALKILSPELGSDAAFAERFLREARAMARLDHGNIVAVYDFGETEGLCWLLMEYVDGVNLRAALDSGAMTPERALAIVPQLCDALQTAHDLGIVHRDIKPENVLLDREGRVKIADFGLAKLSGEDGEALALTRSDVGMGTLHYMAPEQLRGAHAVDHRADIYSLGVVFYEMLTGQLPIGRFEPPSAKLALDVRLDEVVLRALENEPARRYQSAALVKSDVQSIRGTPAPKSPAPSSPTEQRDPTAKRGHTTWFAVLCTWAFGVNLLLPKLTDWGFAGVALFVAQGVGWLYLLTRSVQRLPSAALLPPEAAGLRTWRAAAFAACAAIGITVTCAGVESTWELGTDHYVAATSDVRAAVDPWNEDYGDRLMRFLPEYAPAGAEVPELGTPLRDRWKRWHLPNPGGTFLIAFIALWMAGIALCWRRARTEWVAIATPVLGALAFSFYVWGIVELRQSGQPSLLRGIGGSLVIDSGIEQARTALLSALEGQGRETVVEIGETLVEKRTQSPLARHERIAVRPEGPLDRWRLRRDGPRRIEPDLVIELVASPNGDKTFAAWNAGMVRNGDQIEARWRAEIEALFAR